MEKGLGAVTNPAGSRYLVLVCAHFVVNAQAHHDSVKNTA
jgi:hypothetical protein